MNSIRFITPKLGAALLPTKSASHGQLAAIRSIRNYATNTTSGRRQVTIMSDDGRVNWSDLSTREKAARTTQQSVNLGLIVVGFVLTVSYEQLVTRSFSNRVKGGVVYLLFSDVFSANSKTNQFSRAVRRIKDSQECLALLGEASTIMAYGESPWSSFARARMAGPAPHSKTEKDPKTGVETIKMQFLVQGKKNEGWVNLHMERLPGELDYEYVLLALDVTGHERIYLEGGGRGKRSRTSNKSNRMFGIKLW